MNGDPEIALLRKTHQRKGRVILARMYLRCREFPKNNHRGPL